jgi:hypothetical protein
VICIEKDLPFEDCEICQVFDPEIGQTRMFGDDVCLVNEITITCSRYKVCREIRRHLESKKEGNA